MSGYPERVNVVEMPDRSTSVAVNVSAHSVAAIKLNVFHSETARIAKAIEALTVRAADDRAANAAVIVLSAGNGGIGDVQHIAHIAALTRIVGRRVLAVLAVRSEDGRRDPLEEVGRARRRRRRIGRGHEARWIRIGVGTDILSRRGVCRRHQKRQRRHHEAD